MSITTSQRYALTRLATAVPFIVVLLVYVPAVGHGFISDDFRWIIESRIAHFSDVPSIFSRNTGFYRPLVALTFSADYAAFGNHSLAYGLTNLVFALTSAMLISVLIRDLELPWGAAALGAALWLLNFHGTAMGILWISGRTALLLVLTGVATAIAIVRRKIVIAALLLFAALLAKEEAIVLPFIMLVWIVLLGRRPRARQIHPAGNSRS